MTARQRNAPRWRRRKEGRSTEIIASAIRLFADHGYAATKLDDVALRAGVAKGSIYLYFATKEELFHAVVRSAVVHKFTSCEEWRRPSMALWHNTCRGS